MVLGLAATQAHATPVRAGDPPPFPEFTFKHEKAPKPGERRGPLVQIDPQATWPPPRASTRPASVPEPGPGTIVSRHAWFWEEVSPGLAVAGPERMRTAMARLSKAPAGAGVAAPRLEAMQAVLRAQGADILRATIGTRVSPALVLSVIAVESSGRSEAVSHAGAQGIMQLMPATADRFGVRDIFAPAENIRGGVAYLDWLIGEFGGDVILALAGYNAGENAVHKHEGVPPYAETRDYIPKVLAAFEVARNLCKTRPELLTDACAFDLAMK
ncbi:lytic transglycosylase domain-containing protein [Roseovarius autotrophicus]|uniref:lytic transglycosylase domain-containing protein n=1 Tax=Roseovarius autotrophicus TaxID=2824121 RepID=UPI0019F80E2D|nr:lytic transglycosylase domain-containing protein [Roseovarius autotrophicus]MBE0453820.1 lytic transglycosylase domain-containing protein [Roseovarius sp.]